MIMMFYDVGLAMSMIEDEIRVDYAIVRSGAEIMMRFCSANQF